MAENIQKSTKFSVSSNCNLLFSQSTFKKKVTGTLMLRSNSYFEQQFKVIRIFVTNLSLSWNKRLQSILSCLLFLFVDCGLGIHKQCSKQMPKDCTPNMRLLKRIYGVDLTTLVKAQNTMRPVVIDKCIEELETRGKRRHLSPGEPFGSPNSYKILLLTLIHNQV